MVRLYNEWPDPTNESVVISVAIRLKAMGLPARIEIDGVDTFSVIAGPDRWVFPSWVTITGSGTYCVAVVAMNGSPGKSFADPSEAAEYAAGLRGSGHAHG